MAKEAKARIIPPKRPTLTLFQRLTKKRKKKNLQNGTGGKAGSYITPAWVVKKRLDKAFDYQDRKKRQDSINRIKRSN